MTKNINIKTKARTEFVDITSEIQQVIDEAGIKDGICCLYVPHTTAGITINEGADPSVVSDIQRTLSKLIPNNLNYSHMEGNSDAHIKSTVVGASKTVIIDDGKLLLGTWQSIFFCEFDGPRHRRILVKLINDKA
jgi:secondary thiamine-phosphate synthase enzyme